MKKYLLLVLVLFFSLVLISPLFAAGQQEKAFSWTMALQNVKTGDLIPFSAPIESWNGEQFRLVIDSGMDFYCYVIAEGPGGEDVSVLYAGPYKTGKIWYSPVMELRNPRGSESLFIIASGSEQKTLAQRIEALNAGSITSQRALMNEIFRLRGEVSKYNEKPEKPIFMGGVSRGNPEKSRGVEFSGLGTYVKAISIEH